MANDGGDGAFGGDADSPGPQFFNQTHIIMAFDVDSRRLLFPAPEPSWSWTPTVLAPVNKVRRVALFEGRDQFGRLQPMLGGEKDANIVESFTWTEPTTETPGVGQIE